MSADNDDIFFASLNKPAHRDKVWYRDEPLHASKVSQLNQNACEVNNIIDVGEKEGVETHRLRGTVATLLNEARTSNFATKMSTGHRQAERLKNY